MTEQDLLQQLKDITEPAPIGWWPPAPGWWILVALILIALAALAVWLFRRHRNNRFRKQAQHELDVIANRFEHGGDARHYLEALNALLKRVAITRYGRNRVAPLSGQAWCQFLTDQAPGVDFMHAPGSFLAEGLYRPLDDLPAQALQTEVRRWIRRCR